MVKATQAFLEDFPPAGLTLAVDFLATGLAFIEGFLAAGRLAAVFFSFLTSLKHPAGSCRRGSYLKMASREDPPLA